MAGDGKQQSILDASTVTTSPAFQVQVSGGTTSAPASAFYVKILDVGFLGNIAGPVIALGKADISDYLNNIDTNIWVGNQSTSASAIGTQVNGMTGPNVLEIVSNNAGHGDAIQVRAAAFTEFHVSGGSADNAMHFTGSGYIFGNTIVSPDFEVVRHSVLIDAANASYNTFVGGQLAYSVSAISATAGGSGTAGGTNLFINPNFAAASQTLASLTWSGATVTGTTSVPHGFTNGTTVTMVVSGATPTAYNGTYAVTFTGASTFTYSLASNPGTETVPGIVYPQSNAIDANGSAGVTVQTAGGPTAGNAPAVWSLSNIAGTGWQTQVSVAGAATTTNYVASQPMIWNVQTGGSYSWTVNGVQALGLTASGGGVFSGAVTSANFQSTGTNAGYFTADRTGAGQAGLFRAGGINYLFDSTYGTALSWTGSGAISIPGALTVGGALTGATASLTGVVSIGGTPPSTGELNVVGASGGIALALSDNVNSSFYVRTSTSGILLGTDPGGLMLFAAGGNAASNTKMNISSAGNVTIGNGSGTQTTYTFDVLGTGNFTGALTGAAATFSGTVTSSNYQSAGSNSGYFATDRSGTGTAGFFRSGGINYLYDSVYGLALSWNGSGQVAVPGALSVSGGSLTVSNSGSTLFTVTSGGAQINTNLYAPGYQEALATPSSSSAACAAGQFGDDGSYHYVCTATNTWKRVALSSF